MLVSVPILTFNHEKYIALTLERILDQKINFNIEIVVGEDCSTDDTRKIINKYIQLYPGCIKLIGHSNNLGPIENARITLSACSGKYLALCEGDDYWEGLDNLQKKVDFLEEHPEYAMVHTDVNHYYENENRFIKNYNKSKKILFPSGYIFESYLKGDFFIKTATVVVRRDLFVSASDFSLFKKKEWVLQDLPTWLEISAKKEIKYLPETTATYRLRGESISRTKDYNRQYRFHKDVFEIKYYFWEKYSQKNDTKCIIDKKFATTLMADAYKLKRKDLAFEAINIFRKNSIGIPIKVQMKFILLRLQSIFKYFLF